MEALNRVLVSSLELYQVAESRSEGLRGLVWVRDMARGLLADEESRSTGEFVLGRLSGEFEARHGPLPMFGALVGGLSDASALLPRGLDSDDAGAWLDNSQLESKVRYALAWKLQRLMGVFGLSLLEAYVWTANRGFVSFDGNELSVPENDNDRFEAMVGPLFEEVTPPAETSREEKTLTITVHAPRDSVDTPFFADVTAFDEERLVGDTIGTVPGTVQVPAGQRLTLWAEHPGFYGRPFRGLPVDTFEAIVNVLELFTDADLRALVDLSGTRIFDSGFTHRWTEEGPGEPAVGDSGMRTFRGFDRLEWFGMREVGITDPVLSHLSDCPLRRVLLRFSPVTSAGLEQLPLEKLTHVSVDFTPTIGRNLRFLNRTPSLRHLGLRAANVSDRQVRHIAGLRRLETLDLTLNRTSERLELDQTVTDKGVRSLRNLDQLESLMLGGTAITSRSSRVVADLPKLRHLSLLHTEIDDRALRQIGKMRQLESLDISHTKITDNGLKKLTGLHELKTLHVENTDITDEALGIIHRLRSIEHLSLYDTRVTHQGLYRLAELPNLKRLTYYDELPDEVVAKLKDLMPDVSFDWGLT